MGVVRVLQQLNQLAIVVKMGKARLDQFSVVEGGDDSGGVETV